MMPNGDLKQFLRDSRPLELNPKAVRDPPEEKVKLIVAYTVLG